MMLHLASASRGNQLGEWFASDACEGEVNNVGVAEKMVKKWFYRFQRVGSTELKENYPHTPCCARHFPTIPRTDGNVPRMRQQSQWRVCKKFLVHPCFGNSKARHCKIQPVPASWYVCQSCRILRLTSPPCNHES